MTAKTLLTLASMSLFSGLLFSEAAFANHYTARNSARARSDIRNDWAEIRRDRAELRRDIDEYHESRHDLRSAIRRGAPPHVVARRRAEVREDFRDVAESRRDLRRDYRELNQDLDKYGWYRHSDGRWYRSNRYGSWNRDDRGRWPWNNWWR